MRVGKQWREVLVRAGVRDPHLPGPPFPPGPPSSLDPHLCHPQTPALLSRLCTAWTKTFSIPSPFYFQKLKCQRGLEHHKEHEGASHNVLYFPPSFPDHISSGSSPAHQLGWTNPGPFPASRVTGVSLEVGDPQESRAYILKPVLVQVSPEPSSSGGGCSPPKRETLQRPGKQIQTTRRPQGLPSH